MVNTTTSAYLFGQVPLFVDTPVGLSRTMATGTEGASRSTSQCLSLGSMSPLCLHAGKAQPHIGDLTPGLET